MNRAYKQFAQHHHLFHIKDVEPNDELSSSVGGILQTTKSRDSNVVAGNMSGDDIYLFMRQLTINSATNAPQSTYVFSVITQAASNLDHFLLLNNQLPDDLIRYFQVSLPNYRMIRLKRYSSTVVFAHLSVIDATTLSLEKLVISPELLLYAYEFLPDKTLSYHLVVDQLETAELQSQYTALKKLTNE